LSKTEIFCNQEVDASEVARSPYYLVKQKRVKTNATCNFLQILCSLCQITSDFG